MDPSEYRSLIDAYKKIQIIGENNFEPLSENTRISVFSITNEENFDYGVIFFNFLAQIFKGDCDFGFINEEATEDNLLSLREGITGTDAVIFAFFVSSDVLDDDDLIIKLNNIIQTLSESKPAIGVFFSPNHIPEELNLSVKINLPNIDNASIAAGAMFLAGREPMYTPH